MLHCWTCCHSKTVFVISDCLSLIQMLGALRPWCQCRWLHQRTASIRMLYLDVPNCEDCDDPDTDCEEHACSNHVDMLDGGLIMALASLAGRPLDVGVTYERKSVI